ncbi:MULTISPECIES: hypothetical protein [Faecalibacterium]|uniref:hypothetical protein n=1 Tax=Faecalibacterium TaxID=216851 RepID=UPI0011C2352A|nr:MULTISPECIES: hypothetical protein [Faecalibacterium]
MTQIERVLRGIIPESIEVISLFLGYTPTDEEFTNIQLLEESLEMRLKSMTDDELSRWEKFLDWYND